MSKWSFEQLDNSVHFGMHDVHLLNSDKVFVSSKHNRCVAHRASCQSEIKSIKSIGGDSRYLVDGGRWQSQSKGSVGLPLTNPRCPKRSSTKRTRLLGEVTCGIRDWLLEFMTYDFCWSPQVSCTLQIHWMWIELISGIGVDRIMHSTNFAKLRPASNTFGRVIAFLNDLTTRNRSCAKGPKSLDWSRSIRL